jgi:hypothetical protein
MRWIFSLILLAGCPSPHSSKGPIAPGSGVDGSMLPPGNPPNQTGTGYDYTFNVPKSDVTLHAHVDVDAAGQTGAITIADYPKHLQVTPRVDLNVVGFADLFKAGFCDNIREQAQTATTTGHLADFDYEVVRKSGAVVIHIPISPLLSPALPSAAIDGAKNAGAVANQFTIVNPLSIDNASLTVNVDASAAISDVIGKLDEFETPLIQEFNQHPGFWLTGDEYDGATGAKDFLCDLVSGKAQILISLQGKAGNQAWSGETATNPLIAN